MNQNIVNYETNILCYRLRTARQRKRSAREGFEKKLKALDREVCRLYKTNRELGWIDLKPPVQRGWKRYFVLREDVARSRDAAFFQGILDKINTIDYSSRKDFKIRYRHRGRKLYAVKPHWVKNSSQWNPKKISFSEKEWSFFEERDILDRTGKKFIKAFVFTEQWRFVLRIRPNLITKTMVRDEKIERRLAEIDNYLVGGHLKPVLTRMNGHSYRARWRDEEEKAKEVYEFKNIPLPQILDIVNEY